MIRRRRERFLTERFLEIANLNGSIEADHREAPDFELIIDGRSVGLEVTELFRAEVTAGTSLRAHESLSDRVMSAAKRAYEELGGRPVHVTAS